jgi:hypothetical protein
MSLQPSTPTADGASRCDVDMTGQGEGADAGHKDENMESTARKVPRGKGSISYYEFKNYVPDINGMRSLGKLCISYGANSRATMQAQKPGEKKLYLTSCKHPESRNIIRYLKAMTIKRNLDKAGVLKCRAVLLATWPRCMQELRSK